MGSYLFRFTAEEAAWLAICGWLQTWSRWDNESFCQVSTWRHVFCGTDSHERVLSPKGQRSGLEKGLSNAMMLKNKKNKGCRWNNWSPLTGVKYSDLYRASSDNNQCESEFRPLIGGLWSLLPQTDLKSKIFFTSLRQKEGVLWCEISLMLTPMPAFIPPPRAGRRVKRTFCRALK